MIDTYITSEKLGAQGARTRAWWLNTACGYNICSIEHSFSRYGLGYSITVETEPTVWSGMIPSVIEA